MFKPFLVILYSSLDLFDHGVELLLTFFVGLGVYVVGFALSMGICRSMLNVISKIMNSQSKMKDYNMSIIVTDIRNLTGFTKVLTIK